MRFYKRRSLSESVRALSHLSRSGGLGKGGKSHAGRRVVNTVVILTKYAYVWSTYIILHLDEVISKNPVGARSNIKHIY